MPKGKDVVIKKPVTHPAECGFVRTIGAPKGQIADWELVIEKGRIHVREYNDRFEIHWDSVSPLIDPEGHLKEDAPKYYIGLKLLSALFSLWKLKRK